MTRNNYNYKNNKNTHLKAANRQLDEESRCGWTLAARLVGGAGNGDAGVGAGAVAGGTAGRRVVAGAIKIFI